MMEQNSFQALVVKERDGKYVREIQERQFKDLPEGELLIRVHYSSLNYKDALSASGNKGVTRNYPHTPGIDAAGTVESSESNRFSPGDKVIVTGFDLGMNTSGGYGQYIRVPSEWVLPLPKGLSLREAMILGTAGLTAGTGVSEITRVIKPEDGEVIVSGATGGVGSLSISILRRLGYAVTAITGKESAHDYLIKIGAAHIVKREDFEGMMKRPLLKSSYAGAIDTVGGVILENILKSVHPFGVIACCGNVASPELELTVYPFILRGITLTGIASQNYPMKEREKVWNKLAGEWKSGLLDESCTEVKLDELSDQIDLMLDGKLQGRTLVSLEV